MIESDAAAAFAAVAVRLERIARRLAAARVAARRGGIRAWRRPDVLWPAATGD